MLYTMFSIPFSLWILKGFIDGVSPRFDETVWSTARRACT